MESFIDAREKQKSLRTFYPRLVAWHTTHDEFMHMAMMGLPVSLDKRTADEEGYVALFFIFGRLNHLRNSMSNPTQGPFLSNIFSPRLFFVFFFPRKKQGKERIYFQTLEMPQKAKYAKKKKKKIWK